MNAQSLKQMGLDLPAGSVMLYLEQVDYDRNRQPVAVSYEYHVSDFCEFKVYRRR
jgi:DNA-binding GntR family transcriptional regulator